MPANGIFADHTIYVRGHNVKTRVRHSRATVRRIYVREDTTVLPATEANVPVSMSYVTLHAPPSDCVADTKELAPGVFTARTLLPPEDQFAAVRVVNLSTKPFTVRAGLCMGLADSAECLSGYGTRDGRPTDPAVRGLPVRTVQGGKPTRVLLTPYMPM